MNTQYLGGISRRGLIVAGAAMLAGPRIWAADAPAAMAADPLRGLKLGIATYSFRKFNLEETIKGIQRVGVKYVSIKDFHLPMKSTAEQRKETVAKFKAAGITPLSVGVVTLPKDEAVCRAAFEYARDCGVPVMVANPVPEALPTVEKLVKEFDIRIAIHNHGPEDKRWPTPNSAIDAIRNMDGRIGICIDVGHTARAGVDPAKAILDFADRLFDLHIKDISDVKGKGASAELEVGRGVLNLKAMLAALLKIKFAGHVGLEYEKDPADPIPGIAESVGFIRGVTAALEG